MVGLGVGSAHANNCTWNIFPPRRVTIFRSPNFRAAQICLNVFDLSEGSEGIITFDMGLRGLATLLKTLNYIPDCS